MDKKIIIISKTDIDNLDVSCRKALQNIPIHSTVRYYHVCTLRYYIRRLLNTTLRRVKLDDRCSYRNIVAPIPFVKFRVINIINKRLVGFMLRNELVALRKYKKRYLWLFSEEFYDYIRILCHLHYDAVVFDSVDDRDRYSTPRSLLGTHMFTGIIYPDKNAEKHVTIVDWSGKKGLKRWENTIKAALDPLWTV